MSPLVVTCSAGEARQLNTLVQWNSKQASVVNVSFTTAQAQRHDESQSRDLFCCSLDARLLSKLFTIFSAISTVFALLSRQMRRAREGERGGAVWLCAISYSSNTWLMAATKELNSKLYPTCSVTINNNLHLKLHNDSGETTFLWSVDKRSEYYSKISRVNQANHVYSMWLG